MLALNVEKNPILTLSSQMVKIPEFFEDRASSPGICKSGIVECGFVELSDLSGVICLSGLPCCTEELEAIVLFLVWPICKK